MTDLKSRMQLSDEGIWRELLRYAKLMIFHWLPLSVIGFMRRAKIIARLISPQRKDGDLIHSNGVIIT